MKTYAVKLVSSTGKEAQWRGEAICVIDALTLARNIDFPEHTRSRAEVWVTDPYWVQLVKP
jgi:hypothetical protein